MELKTLKALKTRLLKAQPENQEQFEKVQNELAKIELEILLKEE